MRLFTSLIPPARLDLIKDKRVIRLVYFILLLTCAHRIESLYLRLFFAVYVEPFQRVYTPIDLDGRVNSFKFFSISFDYM